MLAFSVSTRDLLMRHPLMVLLMATLTLLLGHGVASSQETPWLTPDWAVPQEMLCPSEEDCPQYMWVEPDMTLYVVSMTTNRVAVVPPDGSQARIYDVAEQLQPYPQGLQPGIVPLQDRILLYRFNPFDRGIDILELNRITGNLNIFVINKIMTFAHCGSNRHISRRALLPLGENRIVVCSEYPSNHFNVHVINVINRSVEQTLTLGSDAIDRGSTRPWIQIEVGLDRNLYFETYSHNKEIWGIQIPENARGNLVKYNINTQIYSLSSRPLNSLYINNLYFQPTLVDSLGNTYTVYVGGAIDNKMVDLFKYDPEGQLLWHISNPPLPDDIRSMMLLGDGRFAISDFSTDVPLVFLEPKADVGEDQTLVDSDNDGMENITLDGSSSFDRDGTILSYVWTMNGEDIANRELSQVSLGHGVHEITLIVTDNQGLAGHDTVIITVTGTD
jgi:hypothetical protein